MATRSSPAQLAAVEKVLRQYIPDRSVSVCGLFLEAYDAFLQAGPEKRRKQAPGATRLPDGAPTAEQKQKACAAWQSVGRHDLAARVDEIAEGFRDYHVSRGSTMESWGHAWATWYKRSIKIERPTGQPALVLNMFEEATESGWVKRLEMFFGFSESPLWTWRAAWGPDPFQPDTKVPLSAKAHFSAQHRDRNFKAMKEEYLKTRAKA